MNLEEQVERLCPHISVVLPTLNEARNLQHVLPYIPSVVDEVVLIDGASTDNTIEVAQQLMPTIKIVKQSGKGKGNALKEGFNAANGDIIIMMDADGSTDPNEISRFIDALLSGYDFAKGSRFTPGGNSLDITPFRRMGNYAFCLLVNVLFAANFSDLCYGYNAFWKHCLEHMDIDCDGFEIETLINLRIHQSHLKMIEVPSVEHPRIWGESNLRVFRDGWRVLRTIITERSKSLFPSLHPIYRKKPYVAPNPPSIPEEIAL